MGHNVACGIPLSKSSKWYVYNTIGEFDASITQNPPPTDTHTTFRLRVLLLCSTGFLCVGLLWPRRPLAVSSSRIPLRKRYVPSLPKSECGVSSFQWMMPALATLSPSPSYVPPLSSVFPSPSPKSAPIRCVFKSVGFCAQECVA